MTRDELIALRNAIDATLPLPDPVRAILARWLLPEASPKPGNGLDRDPPTAPERVAETAGVSPRRSPIPYAGKARRGGPRAPRPGGQPPPRQAKVRRPQSAFAAKTAERKLLSAMREAPGASVIMLARSIGGNRSSVGEQLRKLALAGAIEKDSIGRWKLKGEEAREPGPTAGRPPMSPPSTS